MSTNQKMEENVSSTFNQTFLNLSRITYYVFAPLRNISNSSLAKSTVFISPIFKT